MITKYLLSFCEDRHFWGLPFTRIYCLFLYITCLGQILWHRKGTLYWSACVYCERKSFVRVFSSLFPETTITLVLKTPMFIKGSSEKTLFLLAIISWKAQWVLIDPKLCQHIALEQITKTYPSIGVKSLQFWSKLE